MVIESLSLFPSNVSRIGSETVHKKKRVGLCRRVVWCPAGGDTGGEQLIGNLAKINRWNDLLKVSELFFLSRPEPVLSRHELSFFDVAHEIEPFRRAVVGFYS